MNGDILTDLNFSDFLDEHIKSGALFSIGASRRTQKIDYGVLEVGPDHRLMALREKPEQSYLVSMGIYAVSKGILDWIPKDTFFGFDHLMDVLTKNHQKVNVCENSCYWLDIGRPDDYDFANENHEEIFKKLGI